MAEEGQSQSRSYRTNSGKEETRMMADVENWAESKYTVEEQQIGPSPRLSVEGF